jgi:hypothetical protein
MINSTKAFLLAGASALAILACAAEANAETFTMPGMFSFTAAVSGEYAVELLGASGGNSTIAANVGGPGAEVSGDIFLTAGEDLTLFVGGQGGSNAFYGGGGGGSFVFHGTDVLAVAGGGGGNAGLIGGVADPGLAGTSGGAGGGSYGVNGGMGGTGGGGGSGGGRGGGGAGVNTGPAGYGGDGAGPDAGFGGKFPNGGAAGVSGPGGGYGGGGGGSDLGGGGGGSGFSGGGGGGQFGSGGGGGSYLASLFTDQVLSAGVNSGDGSISIDLLPAAVPEPSTWAMALTGFAGLGFLAHMRRRKVTPA